MAEKALKAGALRHRMTVQQKTYVRTPQGGFTLSWADLSERFASIEPKTGREYYFSQSTLADMTHVLTMRAPETPFTPDMRALFKGRTFNFKEVQRLNETRHVLKIGAIEKLGTSENQPGAAIAVATAQEIYKTVEWDFTQTNQQSFTFPDGKVFFLDSVEVLCTKLTGTVVAQPTITAGIGGNLTKYLNRLTTLLAALNKRQAYTTLGSNDGTTSLQINQSVAGGVSSGGTYKGLVLVKGVLVG